MILNDPKAVEVFKPDEDSPIAYHLKIPTVLDRVKYRHAVRTEGGKAWSQLQMLEVMEDGVRAILTEPGDKEQLDNLVAAVVAYREQIAEVLNEYRTESLESKGDEGDQLEFLKTLAQRMDPPRALKEIERVVVDHYAPYAAMVADREVYQEIAGLVAARMFLVGWEGIEAKFKRHRMGVPDEVLAEIPHTHLSLIGAHLQQMLEPGVSRLKNLASRSGGHGDPDRSNGTETPQDNDPSKTTTGPAQNSESQNSESTH